MNSLTPIKSLSQTAQGLLDEPDSAADLRTALDAIARRSEHLSSFVTNYRKVSQWPAPTMAPVDLQGLFNRLQQAVGPGVDDARRRSDFRTGLAELAPARRRRAARAGAAGADSKRRAGDRGSARSAIVGAGAPESRRTSADHRSRQRPGVPAGLERQIFLPFFSAREGGHGIGLTVVRQLMYGMGGRVRHVRPLERGAAFVLSF